MAIKNKRLRMSIRTSSINRTLYQRNDLMATISLCNSRSILDAQHKTGNCENACVRACMCVCILPDTLI
jgi:hypothetical protein